MHGNSSITQIKQLVSNKGVRKQILTSPITRLIMRHAPFCHIRSAAGLKHLIDTHRGAGALFWYWQARVHPAHGLSLSTHGAVSRLPGVEGTQAGILGGEEMLLECCLTIVCCFMRTCLYGIEDSGWMAS